jgi:hypothetical protein
MFKDKRSFTYLKGDIMNSNMGSTDRILRLVIGVAAIATGVYYQSWWAAIGLIPLLTSFIGWCPLYAPFKFSTRKTN